MYRLISSYMKNTNPDLLLGPDLLGQWISMKYELLFNCKNYWKSIWNLTFQKDLTTLSSVIWSCES